MKPLYLRWAAAILAAWSLLGNAAATRLPAESAAAVAQKIEERYAASRTLQAVFLERYSRGKGDLTVESGTVYFSRPGRMRWEYESPEKKLFLADGKHVWFYVPADRTATKAKTKESDDWHTPLALLAGKTRKGTFNRLCGRTEIVEPAHGASQPPAFALRCTARAKDAAFHELLLEADSSYRIIRLLIREPGGTETEFRFGDWKENVQLSEVLFHFHAPPGVAIVEEGSILPQPARPPK